MSFQKLLDLKLSLEKAGWANKDGSWIHPLSDDFGVLRRNAVRAGFCHKCGLESRQICFHRSKLYQNERERLLAAQDMVGAARFALNFYQQILDSLVNLPEHPELLIEPPHTFFLSTYQNWLPKSELFF